MKHTIAIVDDHILIAKAIGAIVSNFAEFELLYECENGRELQEKFKLPKNIPDILLLDISMPIMDGFATASWLKENHPKVLIMALSMQDDEESVVKMIKAGARGYLHKNIHPVELQKSLNSLLKKGLYYPDWATAKIFSSVINSDKEITQEINITKREMEFLGWICTELTYKEIGEKMFCSSRTVESYRDALFEKLNIKTRVALALFSVKMGIYKL
jgi:DNA-binding NarL/FixJ family response regulator